MDKYILILQMKLSLEQKSIITNTYFTLTVVVLLSIIIYFIVKSQRDKISDKDIYNTSISSIGIGIIVLIFYVILSIFSNGGRKYSISMRILYYTFLISTILFVSFISTMFSEDSIEYSLYATLAITGVMTIIGFVMIKSGIQFNMSYFILAILLLIAICMSIILKNTTDKDNQIRAAVFMTVIFLFILIVSFDTWYFVASKEVLNWTKEMRYQQAVMNIWSDMFNIFFRLLYLLEG